jgi:hypothetical protein
MPQAEVLQDLPQHTYLVIHASVTETLREAFPLECPYIGDINVADQAVFEFGGQRLNVLSVIAKGAFALSDLRFDPFFSRDREQRNALALPYPVDAKLKVAPTGTFGFSRDRFRIRLGRLADKLPLKKELVPVCLASFVNAHPSSSPRTASVAGLSQITVNFAIQHDYAPPEVRSPESAALDLQTDERHRDAEAAG